MTEVEQYHPSDRNKKRKKRGENKGRDPVKKIKGEEKLRET